MNKLKIPAYPFKGQTFSLEWAEKYLLEQGFKPITKERIKADPSLKAACKMPRT
jgi:hypothetical protein